MKSTILNIVYVVLLLLIFVGVFAFHYWLFEKRRKERQEYYMTYLQSDEWKRKRYVVLRRDNLSCVYCGAKATQVHHLRYAKYNIGKEPIKWLVSVCDNCHKSIHNE